ncbi:MAG: VOC family protein [Bacteroidota bacterium]
MITETQFIIYIENQQESAVFYSKLLQLEATLNVPGMTEFTLPNKTKIGLMPNAGIAKIITPALPNPQSGNGIPRCEIYLMVNDVEKYYTNALAIGAKNISAPENRNWNHFVGYVADKDGHVIAFAKEINNQ